MRIDALMSYAIVKKSFLVTPHRELWVQLRPYLELTLELTVKIVCIETVNSLRRCWREEIIPIL